MDSALNFPLCWSGFLKRIRRLKQKTRISPPSRHTYNRICMYIWWLCIIIRVIICIIRYKTHWKLLYTGFHSFLLNDTIVWLPASGPHYVQEKDHQWCCIALSSCSLSSLAFSRSPHRVHTQPPHASSSKEWLCCRCCCDRLYLGLEKKPLFLVVTSTPHSTTGSIYSQ